MASEKGNAAKIAAGGGSAAVGGAILLKTLKTKKISPKEKKELVEVVKKEVKEAGNKKAGDYIYQKALRTRGARKAAHKASVRAAGSQGAGWFARGYSDINNNNGMEIRRKVFSLLQDESGEEKYYSTTEFELSWDEEGEKLFSERKRISHKERRQLRKELKNEGLTRSERSEIVYLSRAKKKDLEDDIKRLEGDEEEREKGYKKAKKAIQIINGATLAATGAVNGAAAGGIKGAIAGGTVGAAAGAGLGTIIANKAIKESRKHRDDKRYAAESEMRADKEKVALRKMSPKEFREKWGGGYYSKDPKEKKNR